MSDYLDPNNEELLKDFFSEAQSQIEILEQNILVLESDPSNRDAVDEIFRAAHTLKGGSATVQMTEIAGFTHLIEDLLDAIRAGDLSPDEDLVDTLLASVDVIKEMLECRRAGEVSEAETETLKSRLEAFLKPKPAGAGKGAPKAAAKSPAKAPAAKAASKPEAKAAPSAPAAPSRLSEYDELELREAAQGKPVYCVAVTFDESNPMNSVGGIQVFAALKDIGHVLKTVPDFDQLYEDTFYPVVEYYLTCDDLDLLDKRVQIADVTLGYELSELKEDRGTKAAPDPAPAKSAPASAQASEPEMTSESAEPEPAEVYAEIEAAADPEARKAPTVSSGSVLRVDSKRIDNLLNLVSETVINKATFNQLTNQFGEALLEFQSAGSQYKELMKDLFESFPDYLEELRHGKSLKDVKKDIQGRFGRLGQLYDPLEARLKQSVGLFKGTSQNLGRIIGELHEGVLRIRMVPISQIFSRFPRLVRDLSKTLSKKVDLVIEGEDTELDKSVIEDLLDPLMHCVRNSVDHGIETPEGRRQSGKKEIGQVQLSARNEGNMIIIEVIDDGRGIDVEAVKRKAVERGLIHPNKNISDVEAFNLIFEPGFSTAASITSISGRGVGLDVVRKQLEKLNGSVNVWSEPGKGTRFTIKLPLTLAIIQGLLVRVGKEIYAIPITSVIDSHRIKPTEIKIIDNYEVFNVRKDVISLLRLDRLFGIQAAENAPYHFVVVVGSGDKKMGLLVDSLIGEEDVVIKPLKDRYTASPGIAGATILGDGKVSLIIDVSQLLELGLRNERAARQKRESRIG